MTPSLKKLTILGLATGIAQMLLDQSDDAKVHWRSQVLYQASQLAVDKCNVTVDKSRLRQAQVKIDEVCLDGQDFDIVDMLSFLLIGLDDLQTHCKDISMINVMIKRTNWLLQYFDPKLESAKIFEDVHGRYLEWIK